MKSLKVRTKNLYFALLYYCDGYSLRRVGCVPVKRSRWGSFVNGVESYRNVVTREIYPDAFKVFEPIIYNTEEDFHYDYRFGVTLTTQFIDKEKASKEEIKAFCKKLNKLQKK